MSDTKLDLAIIGGGPAGLTLALSLHQKQADLTYAILERAEYPRMKTCAGGIAGSIAPILERLELDLPEPSLKIEGVEVRFRGRKLELEQKDIGHVVRRDIFDNGIAEAVKSRGIELREGCDVLSVKREGDGFIIETADGSITAKAIAVCTGAAGLMHTKLGLEEVQKRARLMMTEGPIGAQEASDRYVFDLSELGRGVQGYVWDFPYRTSDGSVAMNRGVMDVRLPDRDQFPKARFPSLLDERAKAAGINPDDCTRPGFSERPFHPRASYAIEGAIFVGEAVGIDPLFGEGIGEAMEMAEIAADSIVKAFATNRSKGGPIHFKGYRKKVMSSHVGRSMRVLRIAGRLAYGKRWPKMVRLLFEHPQIAQNYCRFFAGHPLGTAAYASGAATLAWTLMRPAPKAEQLALPR